VKRAGLSPCSDFLGGDSKCILLHKILLYYFLGIAAIIHQGSPGKCPLNTSGALWHISNMNCFVSMNFCQGAVKFLSAELIKVSKTRHLTVKILSADFTAASKNSGKNLCRLLKIDITSEIDANGNKHTSRRYTVVFCFGDEIYDMPLLN